MNKIGIVTVLYNSEAVLKDFFESVSKQNYKNYILYIIDNLPSLESNILIENYTRDYGLENKTIYLPSAGNIGVAAGNNVGIKAALNDHCDYILLSNNDILISDLSLFGNMIENAQTHRYKILVPKIYYYGTKNFWFISGYFLPVWAAAVIHKAMNKKDLGQYDHLTQCDYAPTCFMLIKKEVFEQVGLMDEKYFVYYDDTDFIWRCKLKNIQVNLYTKSFIEHKEGKSTGGATSDFSFYYFTRNRFYFSGKFIKNKILKKISFFYISIVSFLRSIKHNKLSIFLEIFRNQIKNENKT